MRSNKLMCVHFSIDWPTDSTLWRKHNFCQSFCVHLMPKQQLRALRSQLWGRMQPATGSRPEGWTRSIRSRVGRLGYLDFISFMTSDFMLHAIYACSVSTGVLLFLLLYLFLSIHPLFLNVCGWKAHMGRQRDKKDTGLSQTTSIMTLQRYWVS